MTQAENKALEPLFKNVLNNASDLYIIAVETSEENEVESKMNELDLAFVVLRKAWVKYRKKYRADRVYPNGEY